MTLLSGMKEIEKILKIAEINPTPVRLMVYRCLRDSATPLALADIEIILDTVDKSTISRSLSLFKNRHLIHSITDGSGSTKYEICNSSGSDHDEDTHVHFRCDRCGETICLTSVKIPEVALPEGFIGKEKNYIISGICSDCNKE